MKIMIAEDEIEMSNVLVKILRHNRYSVDAVYDGETAVKYAEAGTYDAIVVDIMMPKLDGLQVVKTLRAHGCDTPVMILTAKSELEDKVEGLDSGADDYMTKPFSLEELEARIRAQLRRRGHRPVDTTLRCGTLSLLDDQRTLMIEDRRITLTRHEYRIMELLMQSPGRAFSKREIYEYAWEDVFAADDKTVAVHISNIRGKCGRKDLIETVWGIGFRLNQEGR